MVTGRGLSVSSPVSLRVQSILPPYRTDHFRGDEGGARRHALTLPRQPVGKKLRPSVSSPLDNFSPLPPAASPLQYLRACKPTSDSHLGRFTSPAIRGYTYVCTLSCSRFVSPSRIRPDAMQRDEEESCSSPLQGSCQSARLMSFPRTVLLSLCAPKLVTLSPGSF